MNIVATLDTNITKQTRPISESENMVTKEPGIEDARITLDDESHERAVESSDSTTPEFAITDSTRKISVLRQALFSANNTPRRLAASAWQGHVGFVNALIGLAKPRTIVELGVHNGCSFLAMCDACLHHGLNAEVIGVDTWGGDQHAGEYEGEQLFASLSQEVEQNYPFARLIRADFKDARKRVPDGVIDLLHIDGYHTFEAVSGDFSTWFSSLSPRGICLFHDIGVRERNFGVSEFWSEIKKQWPSIEFHHSYGLGVLFVGTEHTPELRLFLDLWSESPYVAEAFRASVEIMASTFNARLTLTDALASRDSLQRDLLSAQQSSQMQLAENQQLKARLAETQTALDRILRSRTWRATLPARRALGWIKSILR